MPNCKHSHVTIVVDFVMHAQMTDITGDGIHHVVGPTYGASGAIEGWWSKAYFHTHCNDCGRTDEFSSASYPAWPNWLKDHWRNLVAAGGLPLEIYRRYILREEAPCHPS